MLSVKFTPRAKGGGMASWEQAAEKVAEQVAADVAAAVKADERYAPLVASLAEKALEALASA
jgi:hypothetical protein